ncbi:Cell division protein FtsA [Sporotomaculum syntrophicum]|uniref:Cell division protein FtsA n=1 Tax=Sporotomaculum syntrophicum TaxID=182264 RepID=A0A9D2WPR1_9FIRM|nr:cell division protein FtsA [Sporotomaculum syntrophicum]KAF1084828.1 Cell division protein FtsA [Sporotomaculum syntrophicum]
MPGTVKKDVVVGLDIGTSGIAVAVLNRSSVAIQEPLGFGFCSSMIMEKGFIGDSEAAAYNVKKALDEALTAAGVPFTTAYVNVDGPELVIRHGSVKQAITRRQVVDARDLIKLQQHLCETVLPEDVLSIIQLDNIRFYIDGEYVFKPQGCRGRELGLSSTVLAAPRRQMDLIWQCLRNAGLPPTTETVVGALAVAQGVLSGVERKLGVICVDLGAGMTKVVFINHNMLYKLSIFPAGAGNITADLAVGLHTTLEAAEKVKKEYGLGLIAGDVHVPNISGSGYNTVPGSLVHKIIKSRIEEILDFVKEFIEELDLGASLPGGIVLTGGGALLNGLTEVAQEYWLMPVRIGFNSLPGEEAPNEDAYRYTTAIGLASWGTGQVYPGMRQKAEKGFKGRIKSWFR